MAEQGTRVPSVVTPSQRGRVGLGAWRGQIEDRNPGLRGVGKYYEQTDQVGVETPQHPASGTWFIESRCSLVPFWLGGHS